MESTSAESEKTISVLTLPDPLLSPARFEIKTCQSHTHIHTHNGCDDLSGLVSLLIHLAPSKSHPLTEADISCLNWVLAESVALIPCQRYFISSHFWRCNIYSEQSEDLWEPLFPLIIHQCVVFIYLFTFLFFLPGAARHCSPCFMRHLLSLSLSLLVAFDAVRAVRQVLLNFCQFMLSARVCAPQERCRRALLYISSERSQGSVKYFEDHLVTEKTTQWEAAWVTTYETACPVRHDGSRRGGDASLVRNV